MHGDWAAHAEYQRATESALHDISAGNPYAPLEYQTEISKLYILNLDPLRRLMEPLYSTTGRPAINQSEIFRAFVRMVALCIPLPNQHLPLHFEHIKHIQKFWSYMSALNYYLFFLAVLWFFYYNFQCYHHALRVFCQT